MTDTPQPAAERALALQCIRALVGTLSRSARAVERRTGITNAQLFVLRQLAAGEGLSINELAARALTGQNTVSAVVARLVERGLARRKRAEDDARRAVVSLTPAGRRLLERAPEPPAARLLSTLQRLPAESVRALASSLAELVHAMGLSEQVAGLLFEEGDVPAAHPDERARARVATHRLTGRSGARRRRQAR